MEGSPTFEQQTAPIEKYTPLQIEAMDRMRGLLNTVDLDELQAILDDKERGDTEALDAFFAEMGTTSEEFEELMTEIRGEEPERPSEDELIAS